jgi:hypothetical protein
MTTLIEAFRHASFSYKERGDDAFSNNYYRVVPDVGWALDIVCCAKLFHSTIAVRIFYEYAMIYAIGDNLHMLLLHSNPICWTPGVLFPQKANDCAEVCRVLSNTRYSCRTLRKIDINFYTGNPGLEDKTCVLDFVRDYCQVLEEIILSCVPDIDLSFLKHLGKSLKTLHINGCDNGSNYSGSISRVSFDNEYPSEVTKQLSPALKTLSFSNLSFGVDSFKAIKELRNLAQLTLRECGSLDGSEFEEVFECLTVLESFEINRCPDVIDWSGIGGLSASGRLKNLLLVPVEAAGSTTGLGFDNFSQSAGTQLDSLPLFPALEILHLFEFKLHQLSENLLFTFTRSPRLNSLSLHLCPIRDVITDSSLSCANKNSTNFLHELYLYSPQHAITNAEMKAISTLNNLKRLYFTDCQFEYDNNNNNSDFAVWDGPIKHSLSQVFLSGCATLRSIDFLSECESIEEFRVRHVYFMFVDQTLTSANNPNFHNNPNNFNNNNINVNVSADHAETITDYSAMKNFTQLKTLSLSYFHAANAAHFFGTIAGNDIERKAKANNEPRVKRFKQQLIHAIPTSVESLTIDYCFFADEEFFAELSDQRFGDDESRKTTLCNLTTLDIGGNRMANPSRLISPIYQMKSLKTLHCQLVMRPGSRAAKKLKRFRPDLEILFTRSGNRIYSSFDWQRTPQGSDNDENDVSDEYIERGYEAELVPVSTTATVTKSTSSFVSRLIQKVVPEKVTNWFQRMSKIGEGYNSGV